MKAYPLTLDGLPPARRSRWSVFLDRHLPRFVFYLMVLTFVGIVLFPHVVVTVPSGHVGVLWRRFGNGTVVDPRQLRNEGLRGLLPWNLLYIYDLRLQSMTDTYNAISSDGVSLTATMNVRFRLQRDAVPVLHQAVGPDYLKLGKYPTAEPGALVMGPLEAAVGVADAAPNLFGHLKVALSATCSTDRGGCPLLPVS